MNVDLFTDNLNALKNEELFAVIGEFCSVQPSEGWRHDYAEQWGDSALQKVAAFANTFGGLLIIGVKKGKHDTECQLVGVNSNTKRESPVRLRQTYLRFLPMMPRSATIQSPQTENSVW
jgi:predicted HTH transcriptional regulator